jgi:hypothetical protein
MDTVALPSALCHTARVVVSLPPNHCLAGLALLALLLALLLPLSGHCHGRRRAVLPAPWPLHANAANPGRSAG